MVSLSPKLIVNHFLQNSWRSVPRWVMTACCLSLTVMTASGVDAAAGSEKSVALRELGATAKMSGVPGNKDWPANNTLQGTPTGSGVIMGGPLKGGRVDIRIIIPVDITAIEVIPLEYHGTVQPKAIDIFVEDKLVKHEELPHSPGKPIRIPLQAHGQRVGILITDEYPREALPDGKLGVDYGGWSRLRVYSTTNVPELMKPVTGYSVATAASNIALTSGAVAEGKTEVFGESRVTTGHPCTLWDQQDIAHYKEMLKTSQELKEQFAGLKKAMDIRMTEPLGIPQPKQGPDGKWLHLSEVEMFEGRSYGSIHTQLALDIANLGTLYAFTGEEKYAEFCKKLLLAYADAYPNYGVGGRPSGIFSNHDPSKVCDFRLGDAIWLIQLARGYDLIYNLPSITVQERQHIENDLVKADALNIVGNHSHLEGATNWSAISTCAVLIAGYATNDESIIDTAMYGIKGTKESPTGGLLDRHFGSKSITKDGLWVEGSLGYQFMAMQALVMDAEILWHHGIDLYRYRDCALKQLFDSPTRYAYPDLTAPALHDDGHDSIIGRDAYLYEYAYRRYREPRYLAILNQTGRHIDAQFQLFPVSLLYERDLNEKTRPIEWTSVNFSEVGYGVLRTTTEKGFNNLLLNYGPDGSHGHPSKLEIDLFAFNEQLAPTPGSVWYELPLYPQWYSTTLAHNTLVVDELNQVQSSANQVISATQVVYAPAEKMGIQRAWNSTVYPGVIMDRSLFLTPEYVGDLFGAFAQLPRKLDLAWHLRGQFSTDLKTEPFEFTPPVEKGYMTLKNVKKGSTDKSWSASLTLNSKTARFLASGGTPTEVIIGDGVYGRETPATVLLRRNIAKTIYGNAIDLSGDKQGYVKNVTQEGSLDSGYGLLKVETQNGLDLCFTSYRPGTYKAAGMETDALQAMVLMDGQTVRALYLAGGKLLKLPGATLERSEPGLAYLEKTESGGYFVANPSDSPAKIRVTLSLLKGMEAFNLDLKGKRAGSAVMEKVGDSFSVELKPASKIEFAAPGAVSAYDRRQAILAKRQADQEAEMAKARSECKARTDSAEAAAKESPAPANTVVALLASKFSGQGGGGTVIVTTTKRAVVGDCFRGWDSAGHWLEWTVEVPSEGYYNLSLCYCSELDKIEREIQVNGETQEPFAPMILPGTGGYANGSDDWRLFSAQNPVSGKPLLLKLKKGANVIRLTNSNNTAMNVNYLAITSPDVKPTRAMIAEKLQK